LEGPLDEHLTWGLVQFVSYLRLNVLRVARKWRAPV
jgi:hypothetical protein